MTPTHAPTAPAHRAALTSSAPHRRPRHAPRRARVAALTLAAAAAAAAAFALGACSPGQLTADSSCQDYLAADPAARQDAAIRITSQLRTEDPGNPLWEMQLDASCGEQPQATIRHVLGK